MLPFKSRIRKMELPGSVKELASVCHSTCSTKTLTKGSSGHISECLSLKIERQQLFSIQQTKELNSSIRRWFDIHQNLGLESTVQVSPSNPCSSSFTAAHVPQYQYHRPTGFSEGCYIHPQNFYTMPWMTSVKN